MGKLEGGVLCDGIKLITQQCRNSWQTRLKVKGRDREWLANTEANETSGLK